MHPLEHVVRQAFQRYYGYYANRPRGERRKAQAGSAEPMDDGAAPDEAGLSLSEVAIVAPEPFNRAEARHRWAELLRLIYEVDPLVCPQCGGRMRVVALIQDPKVSDKILRHVREKGCDARPGRWATGPPQSDGSRAEAA